MGQEPQDRKYFEIYRISEPEYRKIPELQQQHWEYARHSDRILVEFLKSILSVSGVALSIIFIAISSGRFPICKFDGVISVFFLLTITSSILTLHFFHNTIWAYTRHLTEEESKKVEEMWEKFNKNQERMCKTGYISFSFLFLSFLLLFIRIITLICKM